MFPDKQRGKGKHGEENYSQTGLNTFPEPGYSTRQEKVYQPEAFADQHVSDVIRENEELRNKVIVSDSQLFLLGMGTSKRSGISSLLTLYKTFCDQLFF